MASSGGSNATWPTSLAPSQELLSAPSFASDNATVDATSGSLDTEIDLPSYNPNVPALSLAYDSVAANPEPIIVVENTIGATVPSQVSAQLTFNGGTPLTTYYYSTSGFNPGRRATDRRPGHQRDGSGHRPLHLFDPGHRCRQHPDDDTPAAPRC